MPHPSLLNETNTLLNYYKTLNWFERLFFPSRLATALTQNLSPLTIIRTAYESTWFFQRWFFGGLETFFNSTLIQAARYLLDKTVLPGGDLQAIQNESALHRLPHSLQTASILSKITASSQLSQQQTQQNLNQLLSHPKPHAIIQTLLSHDQTNQWSKTGAQSLFTTVLNKDDDEPPMPVAPPTPKHPTTASPATSPVLNEEPEQVITPHIPTSVQDHIRTRTLQDALAQLQANRMSQERRLQDLLNRTPGLSPSLPLSSLMDSRRGFASPQPSSNHSAYQPSVHTSDENRRESERRRLQDLFNSTPELSPSLPLSSLLMDSRGRFASSNHSAHQPSAHAIHTSFERIMDSLLNADVVPVEQDIERIRTHRNLLELEQAISRLQRNNVLTIQNLLQLIASIVPWQAVEAILPISAPFYPSHAQMAEDPIDNDRLNQRSLRALAADHESAQVDLTPEEEARINIATRHYEPKLAELGGEVNAFNQHLIPDLEAHYQNDPAFIMVESKRVNLPLRWHDFAGDVVLQRPENRDRALSAYYQHEAHSAIRYLSKPNHWMSPQARFIQREESTLGVRYLYSNFEHYRSLIVLAWLAVSDESTPDTENFNHATRRAHFMRELAILNRAHNWDNERMKLDKNGNPCLDKRGSAIREYYDDGQGDKPSCASGTRSRVFQSVQDHPLFSAVTRETITMDLNSFCREHATAHLAQLNSDDMAMLNSAWEEFIATGELRGARQDASGNEISDSKLCADRTRAIQALNVPRAEQDAIIATLTEKYPRFSATRTICNDYFTINDIYPYHALRFGGAINLTDLLTLRPQELSALRSQSVFKARPTEDSLYTRFAPYLGLSLNGAHS